MKSTLKIFSLIASLSVLVLTFQNCNGIGDSASQTSPAKSNAFVPPPYFGPLSTPAPTPTPPPPPAACNANTINNCNLAQQASGNLNGSCKLGYSGTCSYACNNGAWTVQVNSCAKIDPLTLIAGTFNFRAGGNIGTITLNRNGNNITGTDTFPHWNNIGLTCSDSGTVTVTSDNGGTIQFTRTAWSGLSQVMTGTWTTTDFVHVTMQGRWSWLGVDGGAWDADK
jgi:hypothetical protein